MQKILSQKPAASFLPFLVLLLVLAGTAAFRWHSRQEPLERDLAVFAYVGHQLLAGEKLYTQLWDIKPPGIFVFNLLAERVCGYGPAAVVALGIFFTLLSQAAVFLILRRLANPATGLLGAVFWGLASLSPRLQANLPSTEVLINGFTLLAVWGLVEYVHGRRAMLWLAGAAWALASWIKLNLFFPFLGTCVYLALPGTRPGPRTGWRAGASDYLPLLVPGAVLWAATFAYFLAAGNFRDFYEVVFTATRQYAGPLVANLWEFLTSARRLFAPALADVAVLGVLSLTWMAARLKAYRPLRRSFWLLLAAGEVLAIGTLDQPLPHYYQLLLPLFCLLPALLIHEVQENGGMRAGWRRVLAALLLVASLGSLATVAWRYAWTSPEELSRLKYGQVFLQVRDLGLWLKARTRPGEVLYQSGIDPGIYFYSQRKSAASLLLNFPLLYGSPELRRKLMRQTYREVAAARPAFFIFYGDQEDAASSIFAPLLASRYRFDRAFGHYLVFESLDRASGPAPGRKK